MLKLSQLIPLNYQAEKAKFFADNRYNPQFVYADSIRKSRLAYYGLPKDGLVEKAERLITEYLPYQEIKLTEKKLDPLLSQEQIQAETERYLQRQGVFDRYQIEWSPDAVARCAIRSHQIIYRTGADYTQPVLNGVLNHEIGTHALRRINDEQQPWHKKKRSLGFENSLLTEEGLATIQQHLDDELPVLYGAAVKYFAVAIAQSESFANTWAELKKFFKSDEKLWNTVFRVKRGVQNTATGGGFTKDLVYFEGAYTVASWLSKHNYDVIDLYLGRISIRDVSKAKKLAKVKKPLLPFFVADNPTQYQEKLTALIFENELAR